LLWATLSTNCKKIDYFIDLNRFGGTGGLWWQSRFDKAMIGFLDCIKQLGEEATKEDPSFQLPYKYVIQFNNLITGSMVIPLRV
jgi:hypothetical protein